MTKIKSRRKQKIEYRRTRTRQAIPEISKLRSTIAKTWKKILGTTFLLAALVGIASGVIYFLPKVSVSWSAPLDPQNPFSTPFTVSNDGPLPIWNVEFYCRAHLIKSAGNASISGGAKLAGGIAPIKKMPPNERVDIPCVALLIFTFPGPILSADISIGASFTTLPMSFWLHQEKETRLRTVRSSDGTFRWLFVHSN